MTQENVKLARKAILGWNDRGVDSLVDALDPEVEFHAPKESMNPGVYHGAAGVRDYFGRLAEVVDESRIDSVEVIEVDDTRVIADVRSVGKTAHFEQEIEVNWAWLITVKDGKAVHIKTFTDSAQALAAAGLRK
jgi:ketosteroid isomerase-like protein